MTPIGSTALTAMQQAQDELEDFLNRSPGERSGLLAMKGKGKGGKSMALASSSAPETPAEEALGKVFTPPEEEVAPLIPGTEPPVETPPLAEAPTVLAPGGFSPGGGFPLVGIPGGGGGPGGNPPTGEPPQPPPPPPGAVPEPSTWALLILGFLFTGGMMRRANAARLQTRHA